MILCQGRLTCCKEICSILVLKRKGHYGLQKRRVPLGRGNKSPCRNPPLVVAMCRADAMATKGCERAMGHDKKMSAAEEVLYFRTKICEKKYNSSKGQCRVRYGIQDEVRRRMTMIEARIVGAGGSQEKTKANGSKDIRYCRRTKPRPKSKWQKQKAVKAVLSLGSSRMVGREEFDEGLCMTVSGTTMRRSERRYVRVPRSLLLCNHTWGRRSFYIVHNTSRLLWAQHCLVQPSHLRQTLLNDWSCICTTGQTQSASCPIRACAGLYDHYRMSCIRVHSSLDAC